jgi:hypothetical protein
VIGDAEGIAGKRDDGDGKKFQRDINSVIKYSSWLPIPLLSEPTWRLAALKSQREDWVGRPNRASPHGTDAVATSPRRRENSKEGVR